MIVLLGLLSCATPEAATGVGFSLKDPAGTTHTFDEGSGRNAVVLFFLGTECPVSNFYAPDMIRIAEAGAKRGVATYGVYPEPDAAPADAAKHAEEYGLTFAVLLDPEQALAKRAGITRVPTAVVLTPAGGIAYRGRIDDRYSMNGRRRNVPRTRDLEDALEAVLAGRSPAVKETPAFGCLLLRSVK